MRISPPRSSTIMGAWFGSTPSSPSEAGMTTMSTGRLSSSRLRTDDFEVDRHQAVAFMPSAFFTASSMVPTM